MEYKGKLYGKMGNTYFPLLHTTDDWEQLENKVKELESVVNKNCTIADVSQQRELLLSAICQFTKRNTQKEIQEVEKWIETDFRK